MGEIDERKKAIIQYFINEATKNGPELSADGMADFDRMRRLRALVDLLRARLSREVLGQIYHLHDRKGTLSVGVRLEKYHYEAEKIEEVVRISWQDLNEDDVDMFYHPPWPR